MTISFACPQCGKKFDVPDQMAGQLCACQSCQARLRVPAPRQAPAPAAGSTGSIAFTCPKCQKKLQAPPHMAGQLCVCQGCQTRLRVPAPQASPPPPTATTIAFACPQCGQRFQVPDQMAGQLCLCQACRAQIRVPSARQPWGTAFVPPAPKTIWDELSPAEWDRVQGKIPQPAQDAEAESVSHSPFAGTAVTRTSGLWRDGNKLVVAREARFPDRCVKTNGPAHRRIYRTLTWYPLWVLILGGWLIAMLCTRKMYVEFGVSQEWIGKRWTMRLVGLAMVGIGFFVFVGGVVATASGDGKDPTGVMVAIFGLVGMLLGVIFALVCNGFFVKATYIDANSEYAWVKGVHKDFLASLPVWPG